MTHLTLHSCISSKCTTSCQSILKKPVKLPNMVGIFTSGTEGRVVHIPFYILNTCIVYIPIFWCVVNRRTVWCHILIMSSCQILTLICRIFKMSCHSLIHLLEIKLKKCFCPVSAIQITTKLSEKSYNLTSQHDNLTIVDIII